MSRIESVKNKVAGKTKRLVGEVLGHQALDEEGKDQVERSNESGKPADGTKPLGNLDKLT